MIGLQIYFIVLAIVALFHYINSAGGLVSCIYAAFWPLWVVFIFLFTFVCFVFLSVAFLTGFGVQGVSGHGKL